MGKDLNGKNLGVGIAQRPDGRYHARAMVKGTKVELYNKSLTQLKKDFELEKAKVLREEHNIRPNVTLKEWVEEWFTEHKMKSLKTEVAAATYARRIRNTYVKLLGEKRIETISQNNVQLATNDLVEAGYKERTVREALGILRESLDIAAVNGLIKVNPVVHINIKDSNVAMAEKRVLSPVEQKMFLDEVRNEYYNEAYQILLSTGMRIGEFSGLQWGDVDFDAKVINIRRNMSVGYVNGKKIEQLVPPKTSNAYRAIPFFGETEQLFKSWKEKQDMYKKKLGDRWRANPELGDLVFTTTMGSPCTRFVLVHNIDKVLKNMRTKEALAAAHEGRKPIDIPHIHPHVFRHSFITRCFERKMSPVVIQAIAGHADFSTTMQYTHILEHKLKEESSKIGDFFS